MAALQIYGGRSANRREWVANPGGLCIRGTVQS